LLTVDAVYASGVSRIILGLSIRHIRNTLTQSITKNNLLSVGCGYQLLGSGRRQQRESGSSGHGGAYREPLRKSLKILLCIIVM
jgi:hypothetical protein